MTPSDFGKLIKNDIHGVFLFYGEEQYLKQHYINLTKKTVSPDGANIISISGEGKNLGQLCSEISETASMPSLDMSKRLILVYNIDWSTANKDNLSHFEDCANEIKDYTDVVVIFDTRPETFDVGTEKKPTAIFAAVSKILPCIPFDKETPARLAAWVQKHFIANKINADASICNKLVSYCGRDMTTLNNEILKLVAYVSQNGRNTVTIDDILKVSCFTNEIGAFDFTNAIADGNKERAFSILSEMIAHKEEPQLILGSIMKTYTDMYSVKILNEAGVPKSDIAKKVGLHEYKTGIYIQKTTTMSKVGLEKAISLCKEADLKIKSSGLDNYETIEILLIKLFMTGKLR